MLMTILAGVAIAFQSSMSGQLGKLLGNPLLATFALFCVSSVGLAAALFAWNIAPPDLSRLMRVPVHLWVAGSLLSIAALSTAYWLMPQIGVGRVMAGIVVGQVLTAMIAAHMGWFDLPRDSITWRKAAGAMLLLSGVFLINSEATP
jgi:transporter family-2 protein